MKIDTFSGRDILHKIVYFKEEKLYNISPKTSVPLIRNVCMTAIKCEEETELRI